MSDRPMPNDSLLTFFFSVTWSPSTLNKWPSLTRNTISPLLSHISSTSPWNKPELDMRCKYNSPLGFVVKRPK